MNDFHLYDLFNIIMLINHFKNKYRLLVTENSVSGPGFGQGGVQLLRLKIAKVAEQSCVSKVSYLWLGSRALKWALEAFGFLKLKYAFSHILETLLL